MAAGFMLVYVTSCCFMPVFIHVAPCTQSALDGQGPSCGTSNGQGGSRERGQPPWHDPSVGRGQPFSPSHGLTVTVCRDGDGLFHHIMIESQRDHSSSTGPSHSSDHHHDDDSDDIRCCTVPVAGLPSHGETESGRPSQSRCSRVRDSQDRTEDRRIILVASSGNSLCTYGRSEKIGVKSD